MSLTIFLALCILSLDFMIYVLFKLLYGDRRSAIARRVAAQRKVAQAEAAGLIFVPAPKPAPPNPEPHQSSGSRVPNVRSRKTLASIAFHALLATGRHQLR
jgi:hypothetical protein